MTRWQLLPPSPPPRPSGNTGAPCLWVQAPALGVRMPGAPTPHPQSAPGLRLGGGQSLLQTLEACPHGPVLDQNKSALASFMSNSDAAEKRLGPIDLDVSRRCCCKQPGKGQAWPWTHTESGV